APDEGFSPKGELAERTPHPSPLREATLSHKGRGDDAQRALTAFEQGWMAGSSPTLTAAAVSRNKSGRSSRRPAQACPRPRSRRSHWCATAALSACAAWVSSAGTGRGRARPPAPGA